MLKNNNLPVICFSGQSIKLLRAPMLCRTPLLSAVARFDPTVITWTLLGSPPRMWHKHQGQAQSSTPKTRDQEAAG